MREKAVMNWSGGKDSAYCLHKLLQDPGYEVSCLLTTVNREYRRISMHGVREELLGLQAGSIGIPLVTLRLPDMPTMESYEKEMSAIMAGLKSKGITASVFGDIFLEDLRAYREKKLSEAGIRAVFPLWKIPTDRLILDFIDAGFRAVTTCVNEKYLDRSFVGRTIDRQFVGDLPANVDPCGENGEFHSFVFDGPVFRKPVPFVKGAVVYRKYEPSQQDEEGDCRQPEDLFETGFWYCDLLPG